MAYLGEFMSIAWLPGGDCPHPWADAGMHRRERHRGGPRDRGEPVVAIVQQRGVLAGPAFETRPRPPLVDMAAASVTLAR